MKPSLYKDSKSKIDAIITGSFCTDDIKLLLVNIRDYLAGDSICREIGDYIAHPKGKDRGMTHKRVDEQFDSLVKMFDVLSGRSAPGSTFILEVKPAFTQGQLIKDLVCSLRKCKLIHGKKDEISLEKYGDYIALAVVSILQDSLIIVNKREFKANVIFEKGRIMLGITYRLNYKGDERLVECPLIETNYVSKDINEGTKYLPPGNEFYIKVKDGKEEFVFV